MKGGRIVLKSPTMPRCAPLKMGASGSVLMATMSLEPLISARCWVAPEIPMAT